MFVLLFEFDYGYVLLKVLVVQRGVEGMLQDDSTAMSQVGRLVRELLAEVQRHGRQGQLVLPPWEGRQGQWSLPPWQGRQGQLFLPPG